MPASRAARTHWRGDVVLDLRAVGQPVAVGDLGDLQAAVAEVSKAHAPTLSSRIRSSRGGSAAEQMGQRGDLTVGIGSSEPLLGGQHRLELGRIRRHRLVERRLRRSRSGRRTTPAVRSPCRAEPALRRPAVGRPEHATPISLRYVAVRVLAASSRACTSAQSRRRAGRSAMPSALRKTNDSTPPGAVTSWPARAAPEPGPSRYIRTPWQSTTSYAGCSRSASASDPRPPSTTWTRARSSAEQLADRAAEQLAHRRVRLDGDDVVTRARPAQRLRALAGADVEHPWRVPSGR